MLVLCAWQNGPTTKGTYMVETRSIHTLYGDFRKKLEFECQAWDRRTEYMRLKNPEIPEEVLAGEIGWSKPHRAIMTWFLPENPAKFFEDAI